VTLGGLPSAEREVRLAVTLFLLLLGLADLFGAWQVRNFGSFTPAGVSNSVANRKDFGSSAGASTTVSESPVDLGDLNRPVHRISRDLLVQDSHVHIPAYAMAAAFLSVIVLGLRLASGARSTLILLAFAAPALDFAGLWGAHLFPVAGRAFGALALVGGWTMGIVYLIVLTVTVRQCWLRRTPE